MGNYRFHHGFFGVVVVGRGFGFDGLTSGLGGITFGVFLGLLMFDPHTLNHAIRERSPANRCARPRLIQADRMSLNRCAFSVTSPA